MPGEFALPFYFENEKEDEDEDEEHVKKDTQCGGGWSPRTNNALPQTLKNNVKRRKRFLYPPLGTGNPNGTETNHQRKEAAAGFQKSGAIKAPANAGSPVQRRRQNS